MPEALDTYADPDTIGIYNELIQLAWNEERGTVLELTDRDDLDELTMVELRRLLTQFRNAIDVVSRSLAELWYDRHGESGWVDPITGISATVSRASGDWKVADPDGFAEWLVSLDNEGIAKVIGRVNVGTIPDPIRKAVLMRTEGSPSIKIDSADNPKRPRWLTSGPVGEVIHRG
jgi:hypothetical protein